MWCLQTRTLFQGTVSSLRAVVVYMICPHTHCPSLGPSLEHPPHCLLHGRDRYPSCPAGFWLGCWTYFGQWYMNRYDILWASPGGSVVKGPPAVQKPQEMQVWSLGWEDPLKEEMATHSSILLSWRIPWTEEPGGLQSMGSHRVRHDWNSCTPENCYGTAPHGKIRPIQMLLVRQRRRRFICWKL